MHTAEEFLNEAESLNRNKKFLEVVNLLQNEVLEKFKNDRLYVEKAIAYYWLNEKELCDFEIKKALLLNPNNLQANLYKGNLYYDEQKYTDAIEFYTKAQKIDPLYSNVYYGLGRSYRALNNSDKALEFYNKALKIDNQDPYIYNGIGNVYLSLFDYKKAIEQYNKALKIDRKFAQAYTGLAYTYSQLEDYKKALSFYNKAIKLAPYEEYNYFSRAIIYEESEKYVNALVDYNKVIELTNNATNYYKSIAISKIVDLKKQINDIDYKKISELVAEIKALLLFTEDCVTHYTGVSVSKKLILEKQKFRLSEGAFLNDTSEGRELFDFLPEFYPKKNITKKADARPFSAKPFIGSFVTDTKHDDLTLWRMYGKENKDEAIGCAITFERKSFLEKLIQSLIPGVNDETLEKSREEFNFYRVAYRNQNSENGFIVPGFEKEKIGNLNKLMIELKKKSVRYLAKKEKSVDRQNLIELLNSIAYLFKSIEYQYENELRLVVKGTGISKGIDFELPPFKVYIELIEISSLIRKITLGPKVTNADELAAAFYYALDKKNYHPEILISRLPFK